MSRLIWNLPGTNEYEAGVDRGVYYSPDGTVEAWPGLVSVVESVEVVGSKNRFLDGSRRPSSQGREYFGGTIEAMTYPSSFDSDVLITRRPKPFTFSYRVMKESFYEIHIVYNVLLAPSSFENQVQNTSAFQWDFTTRQMAVDEETSSAHLVISSSVAHPQTIQALEEALYGSEERDPAYLTPPEIFQIFEENSIVRIIDHGDGTWTAIGPDDMVYMTDDTSFVIDSPSAVWISSTEYTVHSL